VSSLPKPGRIQGWPGDIERNDTDLTARLGDRLTYIGGLPTAETFALPYLEMGVYHVFLGHLQLPAQLRARVLRRCSAGAIMQGSSPLAGVFVLRSSRSATAAKDTPSPWQSRDEAIWPAGGPVGATHRPDRSRAAGVGPSSSQEVLAD